MADKVKFNLFNVYYAILQDPASYIPVYSAPVKIPGAVALTFDTEGKAEILRADGNTWFDGDDSASYEGELEIALIPESFRTGVLKELTDSNGVLAEKAGEEKKNFALLFQFDTDDSGIRHVLYNCAVSRPLIAGKSDPVRRVPQTDKLYIKAMPLRNGYIKSETGADTSQSVINSLFSSVYLPVTTFSVSPASLTIAPGDTSAISLVNALGPVSVNVTGSGAGTLDISCFVDRKTLVIEVDEDTDEGSYTVTLTDSGRTSGNTAALTLTVEEEE